MTYHPRPLRIRPTRPTTFERGAPASATLLTCFDGRQHHLYDHFAREAHLNIAGEPEAIPLQCVCRLKPDAFDRLVARDKAATDALEGLVMMVKDYRSARR